MTSNIFYNFLCRLDGCSSLRELHWQTSGERAEQYPKRIPALLLEKADFDNMLRAISDVLFAVRFKEEKDVTCRDRQDATHQHCLTCYGWRRSLRSTPNYYPSSYHKSILSQQKSLCG